MDRKYRDITAAEISPCRKVTDDSLILKQIAHNLAYIADELSDINKALRGEVEPYETVPSEEWNGEIGF